MTNTQDALEALERIQIAAENGVGNYSDYELVRAALTTSTDEGRIYSYDEGQNGLVRYGINWPVTEDKPFILTAIPDGYWTPWHIADKKLQREIVDLHERKDTIAYAEGIKSLNDLSVLDKIINYISTTYEVTRK